VPEELVIGVVVDLPEPVAGQLRLVRTEVGDTDGETIHPHVTLLPPRLIARERAEEATEHLCRVAARTAPFRVDLAGTDTFRPISPVVFVRVTGPVAELTALQSAVCSGPLDGALVYRFHPHVTVAHRLDDDALDRAAKLLTDYTASFTADSFVVYEKEIDGSWRQRRRIAFGGEPVVDQVVEP
jgi:2'-5' RNA ligase